MDGVFAAMALGDVAEACLAAGDSHALLLLLRALECTSIEGRGDTAGWPLEQERVKYYAELDRIRREVAGDG